jgi:hypothetical protein
MLNFIKRLLYRLDILEGRVNIIERHITGGSGIVVFRKDTLENWKKSNPIPRDKEICLVTDNPGFYKKGDGKTKFMDLPTKQIFE